ncbi:TVP38/TMEM64 family protein [Ignavigranum ruoffiae]|uniref:TVP38/TMEM64 family membrane protein n=1 Tax=Ignavigranum ruoffiae TaxID=89093 RepID=A0A1H9GES9_9LACT|nr:VTT domain-containing protein [Ignavigranum ruoffiae]UPQ86317.1 VTT domain-containing protein [Ignavigranum ruoffiae]SEQ48567.1 Uncharacterized membrane protein YdjX, TVP38/TMEM64 family, SNARE-associated domain [Ignavigranum ruoffiae]
MRLSLEKKRQIIRITTIIGIILTIIGFFVVSQSTYFDPGQGFEQLLRRLGFFAPFIFVLVQISQIIYPIIPMGLTNVIGFLIFGTFLGTVLNVIGLITGSAINFFLGRRFGGTIVRAFIDDEQYDKYVGMLNRGKAFDRLIMVGFIAPIFPDDIFCMIAGMSSMRFERFMKYVILFRPLSMFVYTFMTTTMIEWIDKIFFA